MKKKKKKRKIDKRHNRHHILASSRGGDNHNNIVLLPRDWHAMWHQLFINLTVEEVHDFIDIIMQPDKKWEHSEINNLIKRIRMNGGYNG